MIMNEQNTNFGIPAVFWWNMEQFYKKPMAADIRSNYYKESRS